MPIRQFADAGAQSTVALAINNTQTSVTLQSASGFPAILANGQLSVLIWDSGAGGYVAGASPFTVNNEYQPVNNISGNVVTFGPGGGAASRASYAGTTPTSYSPGATVAVVALAEDIIASTELKFDEQTLSGGSSVTIPASGSLPPSYLGVSWRHLEIEVIGRSTAAATNDILNVRFNGDVGNDYFWSNLAATTSTPSAQVPTQATAGIVGLVTGATASATVPGMVRIWLPEYTNTTWARTWLGSMGFQSGGTGFELAQFQGNWNQTSALTSVTLFLSNGQWVSGSRIITRLQP